MKKFKYLLLILAVLFILPIITACNNNDDNDSDLAPENPYNGHEYVDLGLSVKWATCNVGATTPEDYGDYFAWGEISPKTEYNWGTYKYRSVNKLTKYCFATASGIADNKTTLELSDDAAYVNWGKGW